MEDRQASRRREKGERRRVFYARAAYLNRALRARGSEFGCCQRGELARCSRKPKRAAFVKRETLGQAKDVCADLYHGRKGSRAGLLCRRHPHNISRVIDPEVSDLVEGKT